MGRGGLAALKVAVVVMGVLIVAGVAVLVVTVARRLSGPGPLMSASLLLDEPPGTSITAVSLSGDRLAVALRGGGSDRVAVVDLRGGAPVRVGLAR